MHLNVHGRWRHKGFGGPCNILSKFLSITPLLSLNHPTSYLNLLSPRSRTVPFYWVLRRAQEGKVQ